DAVTGLDELILQAQADPGARVVVLVDGIEAVALTVPGPFSVPIALDGDGSRVVTLIAEDEAGNRSAPSSPLTIVLDRVAPAQLDAEADGGGDREHADIGGTTEAGADVFLYRSDAPEAPIRRVVADDQGRFRFDGIALRAGENG